MSSCQSATADHNVTEESKVVPLLPKATNGVHTTIGSVPSTARRDYVLVVRASDLAKNAATLHIADEISELQRDLKFLEFIDTESVDNVEQFIQVRFFHTLINDYC